MSFELNPLLNTDSYKLGHIRFYPKGVTEVYANWTPRSVKYLNVPEKYKENEIVVFGNQAVVYQIVDMFDEYFFSLNEGYELDNFIKEFKETITPFAGADYSVEHLYKLHKVGYLPLEIKTLPEGVIVSAGVPVMTIRNTLPDFYWLTNYLETWFSAEAWQMSTSATIAYNYRKIGTYWYDKTGANKAFLDFAFHDFSLRGQTSMLSGAKSGAGHLTSFLGTDTVPAVKFVEYYYGGQGLIGASVPATEHSIQTAFVENDYEYIKTMITQNVPTGIVSVVVDGYDYWDVITNIVPSLKNEIMSRQPDAMGFNKVVLRPDCYSEDTSILTPSGWKFFKDLTDTDFVAQVLDNGQFEFVKPTKIVNQQYNGEMHLFKDHHGKVDLLVTPNHRMILNQGGKERIVFAEDLGKFGHHKQKMSRSAKAKDFGNKITDIDRLRIAFQADGSYCTGSKTSIRFSFTKQRKIDRLESILKNIGLTYKIYTLNDGRCEFNIKVDSELFCKNLSWVNIDTIDYTWATEFLEEVSMWDSSIRTPSRFKFDTTNKKVADIVELICIYAGYGVLCGTRSDLRSDKFSDVYTLHVMKNNSVGGKSWVHTTETYSGRVYCVTVPSGKILVKRNRCTMVCGNSGDPVRIIAGFREDEVCTTKFSNNVVKHNIYNESTSKFEPISEHEVKGTIQCLWDTFGGTINEKGYKTLDQHIGVIYGDSITMARADEILYRLEEKGFASDNIVFGVGSASYQGGM